MAVYSVRVIDKIYLERAKSMEEGLSLITGILWKVYDDYADNKEAYSFLSKVEIPLEVLMVGMSIVFAFYDNIFLTYLFIVIVADCILYIMKENNKLSNVNYAIDTDVWKLGAIFAYSLFIFRISTIVTSFTLLDYAVIALGTIFIFMEIFGQSTEKNESSFSEKENHLFLEASNQKLITRSIELLLFVLFYYVVVHEFKFAQNFKQMILFGGAYVSSSILSILYLKYYYFYKQGKPMFEK